MLLKCVRGYLQQGRNEFFYLDDQKIQEWGIEEEFLKPVIFTLRELACIEDEIKQTSKEDLPMP